MLNKKFILNTLGLILVFESLFMLLSAGVSLFYGDFDVEALLISFAITFSIGGMCWVFNRNVEKDMLKRGEFYNCNSRLGSHVCVWKFALYI